MFVLLFHIFKKLGYVELVFIRGSILSDICRVQKWYDSILAELKNIFSTRM